MAEKIVKSAGSVARMNKIVSQWPPSLYHFPFDWFWQFLKLIRIKTERNINQRINCLSWSNRLFQLLDGLINDLSGQCTDFLK